MARDPDTIQKEIEKTRDELAASLDALSEKANPRRLVEVGQQRVAAKLADPKIKYTLYAVGAILAAAILRKLFK